MRRNLILAICATVLAAVPMFAAIPQAQEKPAPTIKREPAKRLNSLAGEDVFREYCAVCHGASGKGDGPAARALKVPPANLTTITQRHGEFPRKTIEDVILGQDQPPASHGTRDMPIWGPIFRRSGDRDVQTLITSNLIAYIKSLQVKETP